MNYLTGAFPERSRQIAELRLRNAVLDEICRDFEALSRLLPGRADDPEVYDIRNSLAGLRAEIRSILDASVERTPGSQPKTKIGNSK